MFSLSLLPPCIPHKTYQEILSAPPLKYIQRLTPCPASPWHCRQPVSCSRSSLLLPFSPRSPELRDFTTSTAFLLKHQSCPLTFLLKTLQCLSIHMLKTCGQPRPAGAPPLTSVAIAQPPSHSAAMLFAQAVVSIPECSSFPWLPSWEAPQLIHTFVRASLTSSSKITSSHFLLHVFHNTEHLPTPHIFLFILCAVCLSPPACNFIRSGDVFCLPPDSVPSTYNKRKWRLKDTVKRSARP